MIGTDRLVCRLCKGSRCKSLKIEIHGGVSYQVALCEQCDVVQTLGEIAPISPDYVDLDRNHVDEERLWCQSAHKYPAFRQLQNILEVRFEHSLHAGPSVLDIGCGTGGFLRFAQSAGYTAYGFDSSQVQIDHAAKSIDTVARAFSCSEYIAKLRQPTLQFDLVTLWDVLEHVREPKHMLQEALHYMKPGGLLFAAVPAGPLMVMKDKTARLLGRDISYSPWEHVFYYSITSLRYYFERWGFDVLQVRPLTCYPRRMSATEGLRRLGFKLLEVIPRYSPQIYILAQKPGR